MVDIPFKNSKIHKDWQQMAYLQPYCNGNKAFPQLYCQSFENLINFCSSRRFKKQ